MPTFRKKPDEKIYAGYSALAFGVIEQAVRDYYESRFILDTLDERYIKPRKGQKREDALHYIRVVNELTIEDVKKFFHSKWFDTLGQDKIDGTRAFAALEKTYENEIFGPTYEDFKQAEWAKAVSKTIRLFENLLEERGE